MRITGILLAAGMSTRMGRPKQLLPFKNETVIETVISTLLASSLDEVLVVLGHKYELIYQKIEAALGNKKLRIINNPDYRLGMLTSVQAALKQISSSSTEFALTLVDQPLIATNTIDLLIDTHQSTPLPITIPSYHGQRGHPAIFDSMLIDEVLALKWDGRGMKEILEKYFDQIHYLPVDTDSILKDMDTPEDYQRLIQNDPK